MIVWVQLRKRNLRSMWDKGDDQFRFSIHVNKPAYMNLTGYKPEGSPFQAFLESPRTRGLLVQSSAQACWAADDWTPVPWVKKRYIRELSDIVQQTHVYTRAEYTSQSMGATGGVAYACNGTHYDPSWKYNPVDDTIPEDVSHVFWIP